MNTFENFPNLECKKKYPLYKLMTFAFESQAQVLFIIEPTLKNRFLSNWFGPFHQGTK
jgi:hypothetical protein